MRRKTKQSKRRGVQLSMLMTNVALIIAYLSILSNCSLPEARFAPENVVQKIEAHSVAIAVYYTMSYEEYHHRMAASKNMHDPDTHDPMVGVITKEPYKTIAYLGAGVLMKDNHVFTCAHLFTHGQNTYSSQIWIFFQDVDHPIKAKLVVCSEYKYRNDDYAVIKLKENLGRPGIRMSRIEPKKGDKVIYTGTPGGVAFFSRFGYLTQAWFYFYSNQGVLTLTNWEAFPYNTVYPGGPGDSGGFLCNVRGEFVGMMYLGITNYSEEYIFANPISMAWEFLKKHNLEWIGQ